MLLYCRVDTSKVEAIKVYRLDTSCIWSYICIYIYVYIYIYIYSFCTYESHMSLISVGYLCRKFLGPEAELLHLHCLDILLPHYPSRKRLTHLIDTAVQNWHLTFRPGLAVNGKVVGNNRKSRKGLSAGWSLRVLEHQHPLEDLPCGLACNARLFVRTAHWILLVVLIFFGILLV